jgi:hypothetical protein
MVRTLFQLYSGLIDLSAKRTYLGDLTCPTVNQELMSPEQNREETAMIKCYR